MGCERGDEQKNNVMVNTRVYRIPRVYAGDRHDVYSITASRTAVL